MIEKKKFLEQKVDKMSKKKEVLTHHLKNINKEELQKYIGKNVTITLCFTNPKKVDTIVTGIVKEVDENFVTFEKGTIAMSRKFTMRIKHKLVYDGNEVM